MQLVNFTTRAHPAQRAHPARSVIRALAVAVVDRCVVGGPSSQLTYGGMCGATPQKQVKQGEPAASRGRGADDAETKVATTQADAAIASDIQSPEGIRREASR